MNIIEIPPKVRNPRKRKNAGPASLWREQKQEAHMTVNGEGLIARLRRRRRRR
ncbi:MAG: hypothetical protein ABT940_13815 [Alphaproteobacteria bacterium]